MTSHWGDIQNCRFVLCQVANRRTLWLSCSNRPPESSHVCRCCPVTGTLVAQSPCFLYLFVFIHFWNGADQRLDRSCDWTSPQPPLPFVSPADRGLIFFLFFFAKPCQLEAFHSGDICFFLSNWSAARPRASVICQRRPILSRRGRAAGRTSRVYRSACQLLLFLFASN